MSDVVVCVPTAETARQVRELERKPVIRHVCVWDGDGEPPEGIEAVEVVLAPYRLAPLGDEALASMPKLRAIQLVSAGFESWEAVCPPGVALAAGRTLHASLTAEVALAGILMLLHQHPELLRQQWDAVWNPLPRSSLEGRRALIIGPGDVGRTIERALRAFDADVALVGTRAHDDVLDAGLLPELLPKCDVVVLAVPLLETTHRLVDERFLRLLPPGAIVVNVSRGPVVDTDALVHALSERRVRAVLDVTDPEPLPAAHPCGPNPDSCSRRTSGVVRPDGNDGRRRC